MVTSNLLQKTTLVKTKKLILTSTMNCQKTLFIFPKRGLYSMTKCTDCGCVFMCNQCDANLVTYRKWEKNLELVCHQCQSYYSYPLDCPQCHGKEISSNFGGVEELTEIIEKESNSQVLRFDVAKSVKGLEHTFAVTTRIFDPTIPYPEYENIVFIEAHNLLASPDYLVQEEIHKALFELFLSLREETAVMFDTHSPDLENFHELVRLNKESPEHLSFEQWHTSFLEKEEKNREQFHFPPFNNLLLITSHEKTKESSMEKISSVAKEIKTLINREITPDLSLTSPYPSRFLRRKGLFSYHILVRFPRKYKDIGQLRKEIMQLGSMYNVQVRLNPRHVF
jgi:primosomal protein N' (replication factor Y) (superfamily II helicase)